MQKQFTIFLLQHFGIPEVHAFPAQEKWLICSVSYSGKSVSAVQNDISKLKSWHTDLGISTAGFGTQLDRAMRGYKRYFGVNKPNAKLAIQLLLPINMLKVLPSVHPFPDRGMFHAAFALNLAQLGWHRTVPKLPSLQAFATIPSKRWCSFCWQGPGAPSNFLSFFLGNEILVLFLSLAWKLLGQSFIHSYFLYAYQKIDIEMIISRYSFSSRTIYISSDSLLLSGSG